MAEEQSKGIQQIEGCEVIYDMGSGLVIAKVPLDKVKEQDINARIMKNEMQDQLTANIKKRGQLESLPLFVLVDGKLCCKPGKKDSAVDAILADKELVMEFAGYDFDAIMEEIGFYVIDKKDRSAELKYHAYPEDAFYALDKILSAISRFIQQGSYLEFSDNKGNLRRYLFDGEEMRRVEPQIIWPAITAEQYAVG